MRAFLLRRLGRMIITLLVISIIVFVAVRLSGDPTLTLASENPTPEEIAAIRARLGLDQPMPVQYVLFLGEALRGEFGMSLRYGEPAIEMVLSRLPATVELGLVAFLVSTVLGIILGVLAALRPNSTFDVFSRSTAIVVQSAPGFWVGMMLILIFSVHLAWLPSNGRGGISHLIMPVIALSSFSVASIMRLTRSSMIETLGSDYVRFLRSKGLAERTIIWKHAFRNAAVPVIAVLGLQLGQVVGGAIIVEIVFNWPGVGRLMVEALTARDYAVIQAGSMVIAIFMVTLNFLVDLSFGLVDPRIRYE